MHHVRPRGLVETMAVCMASPWEHGPFNKQHVLFTFHSYYPIALTNGGTAHSNETRYNEDTRTLQIYNSCARVDWLIYAAIHASPEARLPLLARLSAIYTDTHTLTHSRTCTVEISPHLSIVVCTPRQLQSHGSLLKYSIVLYTLCSAVSLNNFE